MAINYFVGWTQEQLETALKAAQEELAAGRATVRVASADVGVWSEVEQSLTSRIEMILRSLNRLDPDTYPIGEISRVSSFKMVFNSAVTVDPAQDPNTQ